VTSRCLFRMCWLFLFSGLVSVYSASSRSLIRDISNLHESLV
jgi:hypothetical protein